MANIIKPKRSTVAAKVPTTSDLVSGEIGVNMTDKKIYINNGGAITQIGAGVLSALNDVVITSPSNGQSLVYNGTDWVNQSGSGSGDVSGPASSTDNAITRFDGTTGKTIQNSTVTINDDGTIGAVNGIEFDITPTNPPTAIGSMAWDTGDGTPYVVLDTDVSLQLGQENIAKVYNGSGATIAKGKVVAVSGAQGQRPSVVLADADSEPYSAATLGITTEDIANGAEGFVTTFGLIRGIDTSAFTAGDPIWLSQIAGEFTATKPSSPAHLVFLGWIIKVNASSGEVFVHISNGWELDELHNVLITSPQSGNTLIYDATANVWKNANLTDGTGISVTEGAGTITITNTAPDQVVSLTQGGATTITGTYPNFTISSIDTTYSAATSTVLGLIELGSDTVQSVAANAVTSTASRTYALQVNSAGQGVVNVPWSDSGGTVTSVSGAGTVNGLTLTGTVTTSGNITLGGSINSVALTTGSITTAPSSSNDIVNKSYADSIASGINFHTACSYATTAALSPANTYNNGSSGIGATLTANTNGTLTIDGYTFVSGDVGKRILVKNESNTAYNGIYTLTQAGTGSLPYILTRATDYDQVGSGVNEIDAGDMTLVLAGTTNANTSWVQQTPLPITIGTTGIVFTQFAAVQTYTAGTGLTLTTNQFALATAYGDTLNPYASKTANYFLAAPNGTAGVPTFRAIVAADIPTLNQNTTGSSGSCTGNAATATTATTANALNTANNYQVNSLGVGTAGSGTAGEIRATNNVTAYYTSDKKYKENVRTIPDALNKVLRIGGKLFDWTDDYVAERGGEDGYFVKKSDFGVIAQDVESVFEVATRSKTDGTLAVDYEKLSALAFAAIAEMSEKINQLENQIKEMKK